MKKNLLLAMLAILISGIGNAQTLHKLWEIEGLEAPESVVQYQGHYYVSNVSGQPAEKNGQGFISKINAQGKIVKLKWLTGLNAPKGLGVYNNKLYIADIDVVVVANLTSGTIENRYEIKEATFLNDVEISSKGIVYITDTFGGNAVYQIQDEQVSLLLKDEQLDYPNGLKIKGKKLYVASWGVVTNPETFETTVPGSLLTVNLKNKAISKQASQIGNLDGLVKYKGGFLASDWIAGRLLFINKQGKSKELLDLNAGSADIEYLKRKRLLLVPQMLDGKLSAYEIR